MKNTKEIRGLFLQESRRRLESLGFHAKSKGPSSSSFKMSISEDCEATVSIGFSSPPPKGVYCFYQVGPRLIQFEKILAEVTKPVTTMLPRRDDFVGTVVNNIGYLSPQNGYLMFRPETERDVPELVDEAVQLIATHGLNFVRTHSTMAQVLKYMAPNGIHGYSSPLKIVLLALCGDCEKAAMLVDRDFFQITHFEKEQLVAIGKVLLEFVERVNLVGAEAILAQY